ncbi:MAG: type IX secretion system plug protein domain-containing protein, partial [Prevotella sp.]
MRPLSVALLVCIVFPSLALAGHRILSDDYKSLQVVLNDDFLSLPVMKLGSDDVLHIGFDQLSHTYRRLVYQLEPCNPDWTACDELFESDWLEGFNNMPI